MSNTQKIFQDSILWVRIAICANIHIKKALLNVVHNTINHPQVIGIPSDPKDLFMFLQTKQNKIKNAKHLKKEQKSILLPTSSQSVNSSLLDISLIRWLIQTFSNITNASGNWQEPLQTDQTICANVYRAANMRNKIFHYDDVETLDEKTFETLWKEMKYILNGLNYTEDIEPMRTETLDITKMQGEMLQEFQDHLEDFKNEMSKEATQEFFIQRRFSVDKDRNHFVTNIDKLIIENDQVNIFADAGLGKSVTARNIKHDWAKGKILNDFFLLFFDSKQINQQLQYNSFAAPLFFSELGYYLRKKGKTERNFDYFDCVRTTIDNLIIIIDGIDEFPIQDLVTGTYKSELENKVKNNDKISAADTINAIYFGFLFPLSKICLLGRVGEFERLKEFKSNTGLALFNKNKRTTKELELLKFDDEDVKKFTCLKICNQQSKGQMNCTGACQKLLEKVGEIELCKIPTNLNSLIELNGKFPKENFGRITRTKLMIATLLTRLNEHVSMTNFTSKTFRDIFKYKMKYLECLLTLGKISFSALCDHSITRKAEMEIFNDVVYLKDKNGFKVERKIIEELDFFYVRNFDYYVLLEPHHLLNMEFISACYLFSSPDKWDSIFRLNKDRQLVIISFIAGLHADDYFTQDFVKYALFTSNYSIETFFTWLYSTEHVETPSSVVNDNHRSEIYYKENRAGFNCWYGLMDNQKLSPLFLLMDSISQEVEIPQIFIPSTIVCFSDHHDDFEWYSMSYFRHSILTKCPDNLDLKLFLDSFPKYDFMVKGNMTIDNINKFNCLNEYLSNNKVAFRINVLHLNTSLKSIFNSHLSVNILEIGHKCDTRTIDMILNALLLPSTTTSSNVLPRIQCKLLRLEWHHFNRQQTDILFKIGLSSTINNIPLRETFLTDQKIEILKNVECKHTNKLINIELYDLTHINHHIYELPKLGNRFISLDYIRNLKDYDLIELQQHIAPGHSDNLSTSRIINKNIPFIRKNNHSSECVQTMYLHLRLVDFAQVTPEVFAKTISLIPSLECTDDFCIPSSHWLALAQIEDCQLSEIRIWLPKSENIEYLLKIKTNNIQFIFKSINDLKKFLNHIVNNCNVQLNKEISTFVVQYDEDNWDYYKEIALFGAKTIDEYKNSYSWVDLQLDNISARFHEGEKHLKWWCCEISPPTEKNNNVSCLWLGLVLAIGFLIEAILNLIKN